MSDRQHPAVRYRLGHLSEPIESCSSSALQLPSLLGAFLTKLKLGRWMCLRCWPTRQDQCCWLPWPGHDVPNDSLLTMSQKCRSRPKNRQSQLAVVPPGKPGDTPSDDALQSCSRLRCSTMNPGIWSQS
jgi:hypothetical protein